MGKVKVEVSYKGVSQFLKTDMAAILPTRIRAGMLGDGYEIETKVAGDRAATYATAVTPAAIRQEMDENRLLKALVR